MIILKTDPEINTMRAAGRIAADTLVYIEAYVKPGISTLELNDLCHAFILKHNAIPAPLNYKGFPKSICTSINHVVCHGIPTSKEVLKEGDIVNIDVTAIIDDFHGDTSKTFMVGAVSQNAEKLVHCAKRCLDLGIEQVKPGKRVGDIGFAIQSYAESKGYGVVRDFVGHGIGRQFHEDPQIYHVGERSKGVRLQEGMVFTIEPMINEGDWRTKILKDGWTAVTLDRKLSAQFEHTIAIRSDGIIEILTLPS